MTGLVWNPGAFMAFVESEALRAEVAAIGEQIAAGARSSAPRSAHHRGPGGHGAETIHVETMREHGEWAAHVGWDQLHAYLRFPELGTRYQSAQHFLAHAADRYAR
jgi:HK97 gp10 family phage protein